LSLRSLPNLTGIDISNNDFTNVTMHNLSALASIQAQYNQIDAVSMLALPELRSVDFSHNHFSTFPDFLELAQAPPRLAIALFAYNNISSTAGVVISTTLTYLDFSYNYFDGYFADFNFATSPSLVSWRAYFPSSAAQCVCPENATILQQPAVSHVVNMQANRLVSGAVFISEVALIPSDLKCTEAKFVYTFFRFNCDFDSAPAKDTYRYDEG
jgi:hypothetical protein